MRKQWTCVDYADIDSTDDEGTTYDEATRLGTQVEVAPVLDRVVILTCLFLLSLLLSHFALPNFVNNLEFFLQGNTLRRSVEDIERFHHTVSDTTARTFLDVTFSYTISIMKFFVTLLTY